MSLIDLSIRRPVFAWVLMFSLITFGAISLNRMGISQMPDVDFPVLNIGIAYEGAAPEVVESDLLDPLETQLLTIEGIKEMRSSATQGSGRIALEFDIDRNIDVALQEVQSAISQFRLPPGAEPAVIRKQNPEEDPILILSVYADVPIQDLLDWTQNYLLDQIRFLPGVGTIDVGGFSERNLRIWFDIEALKRFELTVSDVVEALRSQHLESAAGQFTEGERELRVRWRGEATSPEDVGNIQILRRGGQLIAGKIIRVRDVAKVEDGLSDIRRLARYEGKQTVALRIGKQRGTNEVEVSEAIQKHVKELAKSFPPGYGYRVNVDFTLSTKSTVDLTIEKLWVAGVITILICFLFLGSPQAALNILFSIPTSIFGTFLILYFSGFTLNLFTLLALTLSISIVVDDAIMLLENIIRHYRMGKGALRAASEGAREVLPAASAATLAVVAIFFPVVFMDGVVGKFFYQFGITISAAVLISLLEAITITPMRAAALLRNEPRVGRMEAYLDHKFERLSHGYRKLLVPCLRWRKSVVVISLLLFFASLLLIQKVRQEFIPPQDQNILIITGQTPPGTSLAKTNEVSLQVEAALKKIPEIDSFIVSVGAGGGGASAVNSIFIPARLKPKEQRTLSQVDVMSKLRDEFKGIKGVRMTMRDISSRNLSAGRPNPIALSLRGPDLTILSQKAQELMQRLETQKLGVDLDTDYKPGIPELILEPRRDVMAARGVSVDTVSLTLAAAVGGLRQGRFTSEGRRFDLRFKLPDESLKSVSDIQNLFVRNLAGNLIPLSELVSVREGKAAQSINRVNRQRAVSVYGNLAPGLSQAKVLDQAQAIAREILPAGYSFALEGASAGFSEAFSSLTLALLIGILVAYLILAVQFNSFIHPIAILMALPFSVTGALLALWLFGQSLNLFSFIGLIVLMGIAKKNSIMLVEFANQLRHRTGQGPLEAMLEAGAVRLRPILMTSVATVAAAFPLLLGQGMGIETRVPMGLTIIGGTLVSTVLTLFVVPALYLMLVRFERESPKLEDALQGSSPDSSYQAYRTRYEH